MLPMRNNQVGDGVLEKGNLESDLMKDGDYKIIEAENYYKFRVHYHQAFSELHVNPNNVELVAIDGQHRLTSLKSLKSDLEAESDNADLTAVDFKNWNIPVILLAFPVVPRKTANILHSMRDVLLLLTNKQNHQPQHKIYC